jgi:hypothetical protein
MKVSWFPKKPKENMSKLGKRMTKQDVSIHRLIPLSHKFDYNFTIQNLITNIKWHREENEDLAIYLFERIEDPGTIMSPLKVSAFCKKWLFKIIQDRINSGKCPQSHLDMLKIILSTLKKEKQDHENETLHYKSG